MNKEIRITRCNIPKKVFYKKWPSDVIYHMDSYLFVNENCISQNDYDKVCALADDLMSANVYDEQNSFMGLEERPNDPIKLRLVGSYRDYKDRTFICVATKDNLLLHMNVDIFMEAWANGGMNEAGVLKDKFIFAKYGADTRLIRHNSELHKAILGYQNRKKKDKIQNFEYGRIYMTAGGSKGLFLGYVTTMHYTNKGLGSGWKINMKKKPIGKAGLWFDVTKMDEAKIKNHLYSALGKLVKASHNYVQATDQIIDDIDINILQRISNHAMEILQRSSYPSVITDYGKLVNMSRYGCHVSFNDKSEEIQRVFNTNSKNNLNFQSIEIQE